MGAGEPSPPTYLEMSLGSLMTENKSNGGVDDYPDAELTPQERKQLRKLMDEDKRTRYLWSTLRTWLFWIGGAAVAISAGYQWIKDVIRALAK